jgi:hypothetical protein
MVSFNKKKSIVFLSCNNKQKTILKRPFRITSKNNLCVGINLQKWARYLGGK